MSAETQLGLLPRRKISTVHFSALPKQRACKSVMPAEKNEKLWGRSTLGIVEECPFSPDDFSIKRHAMGGAGMVSLDGWDNQWQNG